MFRVARQMIQLVAMLLLLLRRWSSGRNRAPYLSAGCLVVVLAGAVTLMAICCLTAPAVTEPYERPAPRARGPPAEPVCPAGNRAIHQVEPGLPTEPVVAQS